MNNHLPSSLLFGRSLSQSRPAASITMTSLFTMPLGGDDGCIIMTYDPGVFGTISQFMTQYHQH